MDRSFEFWIHFVNIRHHFPEETSKKSSSIESTSFQKVAANSFAFISWRSNLYSSSGSEPFHSSESIFASSWKSAKEIDFFFQNFLSFPRWGFVALNVKRFRGFSLLSKKASFSFIESISCLWHSWKYWKCIERKLETYVEILCQYLGVVQSYLISFSYNFWSSPDTES